MGNIFLGQAFGLSKQPEIPSKRFIIDIGRSLARPGR